MNILTLKHNSLSDTIELFFTNEELQSFLSSLPQKTRTWNKKDRCWVIVPEVLSKVVAYSRHLFTRIDCSALPEEYQREVHQALSGTTKSKRTKYNKSYTLNKSPYKRLYLTPDAPKFIVKAVYKALAFEYHPDRGGNTEQFQELMEAYAKILKEKDT
jgi:hypothetical protein